jgi:hypothetical protein
VHAVPASQAGSQVGISGMASQVFSAAHHSPSPQAGYPLGGIPYRGLSAKYDHQPKLIKDLS